jgi:hypothetical protein
VPPAASAHRSSFACIEDSGVDQIEFIQQGGKKRHDHICQSLELFAREVLPEFEEREEAKHEPSASNRSLHLSLSGQ